MQLSLGLSPVYASKKLCHLPWVLCLQYTVGVVI